MPVGERIPVKCRRCQLWHQHIVVFEKHHSGGSGSLHRNGYQTLEHAFNQWEFQETYRVLQCPRCDTLLFELEEAVPYYDPEEGELPYVRKLFPDPSKRKAHTKRDIFPKKIQVIYAETLDALNAGAVVLTLVGLRAIIEAVCKDKQLAGKGLAQPLHGLVESGYLGQQQLDYLHTCRVLGNHAIHEIEGCSQQNLDAAFDIVEHLLVLIYDLPSKHRFLKGTNRSFQVRRRRT